MKTIKLLFFLLFAPNLIAQEVIELPNPSFEDVPRCCKPPKGWFACGNENTNSPDVQPGWFGVDLPAIDGFTYLGMVVRDNDTWEAVSRRLVDSVLKSDKKYWLSVFLAHSKKMNSRSRKTKQDVMYDEPIKLKIWGGSGYCKKEELLAESPLIDHEYWQEYKFIFEPKQNHTFITFEAFYKTPILQPYNGNILMDLCSAIIEIKENENMDSLRIAKNRKLVHAIDEEHSEKDQMAFDYNIPSGDILLYYIDAFEKGNIKYDSTATTNSYSQNFFHLWEVENKILNTGLRNFIFNNSEERLRKKGQHLKALGYDASSSVIEKAVEINSRIGKVEELSKEEYQYFQKSDELLRQSFKEEQSKISLTGYIERHKEAVLKELKEELNQ